MTDSERPYPELGGLDRDTPVTVELPPELAERIKAIETLAAKVAQDAADLTETIATLARNLESVISYWRDVNQRLSELSDWRDRAEQRLQQVERTMRSRGPSSA